jgi:hypothetical protein
MTFFIYMLVVGIVLLFLIFPFLHILISERSTGGATFGWLLIALCFPILGWAVFLIFTQPEKSRLASERQFLRMKQIRLSDNLLWPPPR